MSAEYLESPDKLGAPGASGLDAAIEAFASEVVRRECSITDEASEDARVEVLQKVVWDDFCHTDIPERHMSWLSVTERLLREVKPVELNTDRAEWKLGAIRAARDNTTVELITTVKLEQCGGERMPDELAQAKRYLRSPVIGRDCPPVLLGVEAQGKRRNTHLPEADLRTACDSALQDHILDRANILKAVTFMKVLGSPTKAQKLFEVEHIHASWHDTQEPDFYLQPENAHSVLKELRTSERQAQYGAHLTDEVIMQFLYENLRIEQTQHEYRQLAEIGAVLAESTAY
jgi:hypothetical protein